MKFETLIIPYKADPNWVEPTLLEIKNFTENQKMCPEHTLEVGYQGCDLGRYAKKMMSALGR